MAASRNTRIPSAPHKAGLLAAVHRSSRVLSRPAALRVLGLTPARVRDWERRSLTCTLEDAPSCPKHSPQQLTREERSSIRRYAEDVALRHFSTVSLALLAARRGHLFAAASTWLREMRRLGIQRPRQRLHPRRSKLGVRASRPNELWHVDASRVRLLDGTVRWLHGIIDNHSRKILAWTVGSSCRAAATETMLREAIKHLPTGSPTVTVITDSGSENMAIRGADFVGILQQVRAQVDVAFSNSMIESVWNQLKHRWLFLHHLDSEETLVRLTGMYVEDHNALIPRAALGGHTPDEVYNGSEPDLPDRIATEAVLARQHRLLANQARAGCGGCDGPGQPAPGGEVLDSP